MAEVEHQPGKYRVTRDCDWRHYNFTPRRGEVVDVIGEDESFGYARLACPQVDGGYVVLDWKTLVPFYPVGTRLRIHGTTPQLSWRQDTYHLRCGDIIAVSSIHHDPDYVAFLHPDGPELGISIKSVEPANDAGFCTCDITTLMASGCRCGGT